MLLDQLDTLCSTIRGFSMFLLGLAVAREDRQVFHLALGLMIMASILQLLGWVAHLLG